MTLKILYEVIKQFQGRIHLVVIVLGQEALTPNFEEQIIYYQQLLGLKEKDSSLFGIVQSRMDFS